MPELTIVSPPTPNRSRRKRKVLRFVRLGLLAFSLILIRLNHSQRESRQPAIQDSDLLRAAEQTNNSTTELRPVNEEDSRAGLSCVDADGREVLRLYRTAPFSDHIIGFSGPSDLAILATPDNQIQSVRYLSGGDTREHVDAVLNSPQFLPRFEGITLQQLADWSQADGVSGATLTSLAMTESLRLRARLALESRGVSQKAWKQIVSLKFPEPPELEAVRLFYPDVAAIHRAEQSQFVWYAESDQGITLGRFLRMSPASDQIVGYQGPSDTLVAIDDQDRITGWALGYSWDNEPYTDYIREDWWWPRALNGKATEEFLQNDKAAETSGMSDLEGVAGATMTSLAMVDSLRAGITAWKNEKTAVTRPAVPVQADSSTTNSLTLRRRDVLTIALTGIGLTLGLTHLRGRRRLRLSLQCLLIIGLGFVNGDMVSQAVFSGWARHGIPWQSAAGLTLLTASAVLAPVLTEKNVYCDHLCPHGAVQQLIRNRLPWRWRPPRRLRQILRVLPVILLLLVPLSVLLRWPLSAADLEPFDAWLYPIAGTATIAIAIAGLSLSAFLPMAYCRYGCPTGTLLKYLAGSGHPDRLVSLPNITAVAACVLAVWCLFIG